MICTGTGSAPSAASPSAAAAPCRRRRASAAGSSAHGGRKSCQMFGPLQKVPEKLLTALLLFTGAERAADLCAGCHPQQRAARVSAHCSTTATHLSYITQSSTEEHMERYR